AVVVNELDARRGGNVGELDGRRRRSFCVQLHRAAYADESQQEEGCLKKNRPPPAQARPLPRARLNSSQHSSPRSCFRPFSLPFSLMKDPCALSKTVSSNHSLPGMGRGFSAYNQPMPLIDSRHILPFFLVAAATVSSAQARKNPAAGPAAAEHAATLAENGHCTEALPLLKKSIRQVTDKDLKKRIGLDGVHCAM